MWAVSFSYYLATVVQLHTQTVMHQVTVKGLLITGVQPCFDKTAPPCHVLNPEEDGVRRPV